MTSQHPATEAETARRPGVAPSRVVPVALLVLLIVIGLRGRVSPLTWQGPLRREADAIAIALEVVFGVLLIITLRRGRDKGTDTARALRTGLRYFLTAAMITVGVTLILNLNLHLTTKYKPLAPAKPARLCGPAGCLKHPLKSSGTLDARWVLYALLIALIIAAIIIALRWQRWFGRFRTKAPVPEGPIATDADSLRDAISEGAAALRAGTFDDARKAIIACYVAMETNLADRGTTRNEADTPDELLSRASAAGIISGTAAPRLTALFYEARFSSHPLGDDKRDQARQALDEIAASLDHTTAVTA